MSREQPGGRPDRVELVVALAVVGLGLFVLAGSRSVEAEAGYDRIGPRFFPSLVAVGLLVSGTVLAGAAVRRPHTAPAPTGWAAVALLSLALGSSVLLLERAGFVVTSTLLFWLVARAFASCRPWRDGLVGLLLSLLVYLVFTRGLGLMLPPGFFDRLW
jgi:putative tricarboxylic transport membrane protein